SHGVVLTIRGACDRVAHHRSLIFVLDRSLERIAHAGAVRVRASTGRYTWHEVPNRWLVRLLVIAIATALGTGGLRVGPGEAPASPGTGSDAVHLSSPATLAPSAIRVPRECDGSSLVPCSVTTPAGRGWCPLDEAARRTFPPEPPNELRRALRALPLTPRPPPLA